MSTAIVPASADYARSLTDRIKVAVEGTWQLIVESARIGAWELLGYSSWDEYVQREFGTSRLRLPREDRSEVVGSLRELGLSTRRIAAITGDSRETVRQSLAGDKNLSPEPAWHERPEVAYVTDATDPWEHGSPGSEQFLAAPESKTPQTVSITGSDGKKYSSTTVRQSKPRRKPLPESAQALGFEIRRVMERLAALVGDERLSANEKQVSLALRGHLLYAADTVTAVLAQLP